MVCKATRPSRPPAFSRAVAVAPSVRAQKIRCMTGGSGSGWIADRQSITREPLSELVTKYITILVSEITDRNVPRSPYCSITSNHISVVCRQDRRYRPLKEEVAPAPPFGEEHVLFASAASRSILKPALPKIQSHKKT